LPRGVQGHHSGQSAGSGQRDLAEPLSPGERAEAKRAVLAALETAPTYERAQQLLLRIVEGKQG
jgi:hypothetical protein